MAGVTIVQGRTSDRNRKDVACNHWPRYTFGQALLDVLEFVLLILWLVLIVLVPLSGVLIYVIARGDEVKAHEVSDQRRQEIARIAELEDLKDCGVFSDEEVQRVKRRRKLSQRAPPEQTMTSPNSRA